MIAGLPASGKTTLAQALAASSGYAHLSSDVVRKRGAGLAPTDRAPLRLYDTGRNLATYAELGPPKAAPRGAIVDATFRNRADRAAFREQLGSATPLLVVECLAPARSLEARARARAGDPRAVSDAGPDEVRQQLREREALDDIAPRDHLALRSERPGDELVAAVADALDRRSNR